MRTWNADRKSMHAWEKTILMCIAYSPNIKKVKDKTLLCSMRVWRAYRTWTSIYDLRRPSICVTNQREHLVEFRYPFMILFYLTCMFDTFLLMADRYRSSPLGISIFKYGNCSRRSYPDVKGDESVATSVRDISSLICISLSHSLEDNIEDEVFYGDSLEIGRVLSIS